MKILGTRTFASDTDGMPVSRQSALADLAPSEETQRSYLLATGIEPVDREPPATLADAYLAATGVPTIGAADEAAEAAESADPLGDAWVAQTAGFPL